jgi:cobalt-zinc-cadmium efflux system outer membrane protein
MRTRAWGVIAVLIVVSAPVAGQTVLSESEALARLSSQSPRVRAIQAAIDVARADLLAAGRWPNPRVTINREAVSGVSEHIATVAQVLAVTGRRRFEVGAASALVDAAGSRADEAVRRARADLRLAYADLVAAQVRDEELVRAEVRLTELVGILERREAAGEGAGFDRLRADRELLDLGADRSSVTGERARAQAAVASFFAEASDVTSILAAPPASSRPPLPAIDALVTGAEERRGELAALRHEVESARFAASAARRGRIPEPEIVAGTKATSAAGGDVGHVIAAHLSIPLFDRGRPELALARARESQAEARIDAFRAGLRAQIAGLRALVLERREAAGRYRAATTGSAAQLERIAQVSYEAGERGILELLDAYRSGSSARLRQAALDAAVRQAEIELEFVSGWEIP